MPASTSACSRWRCSSSTSISARVPAASPSALRAAAQNASCVDGERAGRRGPGPARWRRAARRACAAGSPGSGPGRGPSRPCRSRADAAATTVVLSKTVTVEADSLTRSRWPMNRAGTEYWLQRTITCAYRSTRGVNVSAVSNGSAGSGRSNSRSKAQSCPTLMVRLPMRRRSSASSQSRSSALSSSIESTTGIGTQWLRRNRPPSPSTPPFS